MNTKTMEKAFTAFLRTKRKRMSSTTKDDERQPTSISWRDVPQESLGEIVEKVDAGICLKCGCKKADAKKSEQDEWGRGDCGPCLANYYSMRTIVQREGDDKAVYEFDKKAVLAKWIAPSDLQRRRNNTFASLVEMEATK